MNLSSLSYVLFSLEYATSAMTQARDESANGDAFIPSLSAKDSPSRTIPPTPPQTPRSRLVLPLRTPSRIEVISNFEIQIMS